MKNLSQKIFSLISAILFFATSTIPSTHALVAPPVAPIPGAPPVTLPGAPDIGDLAGFPGIDINPGEQLVMGGNEALSECLENPFGEFSGILGSQTAALAVNFLGEVGLLDKVGNTLTQVDSILSTVSNIAGLVSNIPGPIGAIG